MADRDRDRNVNPQLWEKFSDFVEEHKLPGREVLDDNELEYVPRSALEEYWTINAIAQVMQTVKPRLSFNVHTIRRSYIQTFSALFYAEAVQHIGKFTDYSLDDSKLPLSHPPAEWPKNPHYKKAFKEFDGAQWMFFPFELAPHQLENRRLPRRMILPIDKMEEINHGDAAIVQKVDINDAYNNLVPKSPDGLPSNRTFVLKTYRMKRHEKMYDNEIQALTLLQNMTSPNVITYYGSFRQNGTSNLIIEYADRGSLADFLDKIAPPTGDDILQFWKSLSQVLNGLDRIHHAIYPDEGASGIHEDIKPQNIVLLKGRSASSYDFIPKIADFGLFTHVRKSRTNSSEAKGFDRHGNQQYSSPECSINSVEDRKGPNWITQKADVFSLGAVLSDCAAWIAGGKEFQSQYWRRRHAHHKKTKTFSTEEYYGCFHDGINPLPLINEVHEEIRQKCTSIADRVTREVVDMIEKSMLLKSPSDRYTARQLMTSFDRILRGFEQTLSPASPTSPVFDTTPFPQTKPEIILSRNEPGSDPGTPDQDNVRRRPSLFPCIQVTTDTNSGNEVMTIHSGNSALSTSESGGLQTADTPRTSGCSSPIEELVDNFGINELRQYRDDNKKGRVVATESQRVMEYILENLQGRDQFFFIDSSISMLDHYESVKKGFEALSYVAKRLDPNKVELAFTSDPCTVHRHKKTKKLVKILGSQKFAGNPHMMEEQFDQLVEQVIKSLPYRRWGYNFHLLSRKRLSIYIFTDGNWGNDDKACGVEKSLERLKEKIKKRDLPRNQVSLHFVRFGDLENGKRHLQYLDDLGNHDNWDMVDVKHINDPVHSIAFGPIDRVNDSKVYSPRS